MRKCKDCGETKPLFSFGKTGRKLEHRKHKCNSCVKVKSKYNITGLERAQLYADQNGSCAICNKHVEFNSGSGSDGAVVDHCHKTGSVRGILCNLCNRGIGLLKDDPEILNNAIKYLRRNK